MTISIPSNQKAERAFKDIAQQAQKGPVASPLRLVDELRAEKKVLIQEIIKSGTFLDNPRYYGFLQKHPDYAKRLLKRWYGSAPWLKRLAKLGPEFIALAGDPGIASREEDFLLFAENFLKKHPRETPWSVRKAYADHLGATTVVRALVLTEAQAADIQAHGMACYARLEQGRAESALDITLDPTPRPRVQLNGNLIADLDYHVQAATSRLLSMSVALPKYADVAKSATFYSSSQGAFNLKPNQALYLFTMKIPEISIINHSSPLVSPTLGKFRKNVLQNSLNKATTYKFSDHEGLEIWTYLGIPKESILSVEKQTVAPARYNFVGPRGAF